MVTASEQLGVGGAAATRDHRRDRRRPWWLLHALAYLLVLLGLLAVTDLDASWTFDDGAYATQVKVLDQTGGWAYPYRWAERDPTSTFAPVSHSTITDQGTYPYTKRPLWIEVLRSSRSLFGSVVGLYVPSVLGAVAAALMGWALSERLRPGSGPVGFWAVALGPLVIHSEAMWAHTWGAALGGVLAVVIADVALGRRARWHVPALVLAPALLVSIRTEGTLVVLGAAVVLALLGLQAPTWRARAAAVVRHAVLPSVVAAVSYTATAAWATHVTAGRRIDAPNDAILTDLGFVAARWGGFWRTFVDGLGHSQQGTHLAVLAIACSLAAGAALVSGRVRSPLAIYLALAGTAVLAVRQYGEARLDLGGALLALPLLSVGLGAALGRLADRSAGAAADADGDVARARWALAAFVAIHVAAVIATQYPEGGSQDWGGRFLLVALVPATVMAAIAIVTRVAGELCWSSRKAAAIVLGVLVALPTMFGWLSVTTARSSKAAVTDRASVADGTTVIRLERIVTRGSWRLLPEQDELSAELSTAPEALAMLRPGLDHRVLVIGTGAERVRAPGYRRSVLEPDVVAFDPA